MSSTIYNHRPLQPTAPPQGPRGDGPNVPPREPARLGEAFDIIRQEFDVTFQEFATIKMQRDEYEQKVGVQITELQNMRAALFELEKTHATIRKAHEEELSRLHAELNAVRQGVVPPPPGAGPGIPGSSQPAPVSTGRSSFDGPRGPDGPRSQDRGQDRGAGPSQSGPQPMQGVQSHNMRQALPPPQGSSAPAYGEGPYYSRGGREMDIDGPRDRDRDLRDRDRERDRDRDRDRERDRERDRHREPESDRDRERERERERADREREREKERDRERDRDQREQRDVKRSSRDKPKMEQQSPYGMNMPHQASSSHQLIPAAGPSPYLDIHPGVNPLSDLDPDQVPPELKKEGQDWWAIFNPKIQRVLDVNLQLTLTHESVVCCVRFSADGKYVATGCNRSAQIYDTKTGAKTCVLIDEAATKTGDLYIRSVCFSPDGKYLATGAEDKKIRIWDIAKKRIRSLFDGHTQEIYSLDFSRDGRLIVSGSGDKTARIWDMETGSSKVLAINEPESVDAGVTSVAISPDSRIVAAGSLDMLVRLWDVQTGALIERLRGHKDSVYSVAFTPDGTRLVSGSLDKTLKYWDLSPLLANERWNLPLQQSVVVASNSQTKREGGEKGSNCTIGFVGHKDYVLSVAVSPDGAWVVSGSKDRGVQFWDPRNAQTQLMLQGHKNSVISIDLSPAGGLLATGSGDWQARVWSYTQYPPS